MKWEKAPQELKDLLASAMQDVECDKRIMFGCPAYFISRNTFAGLFQDRLFLRLSSESLARLRKKSLMLPNLEPMPDRPMKDYFVVPGKILGNKTAFRKLVGESAQYSLTLAPKAARKPPRKKTAKE
jgi:TfoX/Sxy family transcriptional regulator of competence genes